MGLQVLKPKKIAAKGVSEKPKTKAPKTPDTWAEVGEYQGKPMFRIVHQKDQQFADMQFGLGKARKLLNHLDELRAFVESEGASVE